MLRRTVHAFLFIFSVTGLLYGQDATKLDWKWHNVGKVKQLITNVGFNGNDGNMLVLPIGSDITCEYPIGSGCTYGISGAGLMDHLIGSILGGPIKAVSTTGHATGFEFFPTDEPWDTIWVVQRDEVVDIPYWPNYKGISDQDFVCRYKDYLGKFVPGQSYYEGNLHPQYLDIIQTTHAWSIPPYDECILYQFYVIPTEFDLKDVYIGFWFYTLVGKGASVNGSDDCNKYYPDLNIMSIYDSDRFKDDDGCLGPIGMMVFPPDGIDPQSYSFAYSNVWDHYEKPDAILYDWLASRQIYDNSCDYQQARSFQLILLSFGPLTLSVGDTLHYMVGEVLGVGEEGMLYNARRLKWLAENNFITPAPPPNPPVRVSIANHQVTLKWDIQPGDVNPETWVDAARADAAVEPQPFEGYRVYKSTASINGPWTLLTEFDVAGNAFFGNTGLEYEYADVGLVNNLDYYYTVTSFTKPDVISGQSSLESNKNVNARQVTPGTMAPQSVTDEIAVVPNPYRGDVRYQDYKPAWEVVKAGYEWYETDRRIQFINIPSPSEIKIYTLSGDLVQTLQHNDPSRGFADWNLTSMVGQAVASGIYLYTVEDKKNNDVFVGKFVIIK